MSPLGHAAILALGSAIHGKRLLPEDLAGIAINDVHFVGYSGDNHQILDTLGRGDAGPYQRRCQVVESLRFRVEFDAPFELQVFDTVRGEVGLSFVPAGALGVAPESSPTAAPELSRRQHR